MSAELEEAVALALYNRYRERSGMRPVDYIGANATPAAERCREDARAALAVVREEMREPTPEMLSIGGEGAEGLKRKLWYHMLYASPLGEDGK